MPGQGSNEHATSCITRSLLRELNAKEIERGLKAASALNILPSLQALGVNDRTKSPVAAARVLQTKLPRLVDANAHTIATTLAHATLIDLAAAVEEEHDGPLPEDSDVFPAVVEAVLTTSGLTGLLIEWPPGLVRLAVNELWEREEIETEMRDRLLDAVTRTARQEGKRPRSDRTTSTEPTDPRLVRLVEESLEANECREVTSRRTARRASVRAAEATDEDSGRRSTSGDMEGSLDALIATAVTNAQLQLGSASPVLQETLEWLIGLDPGRPRSWFPYGILLSKDPEQGGLHPPTAACLTQFLLGRMAGHALQGQLKEVAALATEHPAVVEEGIEDETIVPFLGPLLTSLLESTDLLGRVLGMIDRPFGDWRRFVGSIRNVVPDDNRDPERVIRAETILADAEAALRRWSLRPEGFGQGLERAAEELLVLRASCRRQRRDFVGCLQLLSRLDDETAEPKSLIRARLERALATAGVDDLDALRVPTTRAEWRAMRTRLEGAESLLRVVEEGDSANVHAALLLGLLHFVRGEDTEAAHRLAQASRSLAAGSTAQELQAEVRFLAAVARLRLLEPGTDEACFEDIRSALDGGYIPPDDALVTVAEALAAHGSPKLMSLLKRIPEALARATGLRSVVADLGRSGDPDALGQIVRLTTEEVAKAIPLAERFEMLQAGIEGADTIGDIEMAERLAMLLDEVVHREQVSVHELRWASLLGSNEIIRSTVGPANADAYRVHIFRRLGRLDEARAIAESLFYRAASGTLPEFDAAELLSLLAELATTEERLAELRRVLPPAVRPSEADALDRPVTVLFVGGNQVQESYQLTIESDLAALYGDSVRVEWFHPGWTSNWSPIAERVESRYESADAVVLMAFVRTMFGRRIRRSAGEHDTPWIACTGHGRASVERAIRRAVEVARDRMNSRT